METGKDLAAKQILKVTYSVRFADESLAGDVYKRQAQDDAEVYVNTAYFDIEKTSDAYEWQVGDHVPFNITVKNVNDEGTQDLADDEKYADVDEGEKEKIGAAGKTVARCV